MTDIKDRPVRQRVTGKLGLDIDEHWKETWWGMPEYSMEDASPKYQVIMSFMTLEDLKDFSNRLNLNLNSKSKSAWWPRQDRLKPRSYYYTGPKLGNKYPICIPSKGRAKYQTVSRALDELGAQYQFFVEETEYEEYCEKIGKDKVICLPFHDLGKGSIPARNYIWEWAKENRHKRHWVVDDNITAFYRCNNNRRLQVHGGGFFLAMEDFVDRYTNVAMAGPHEQGFHPDRIAKPPFLWNSRVYSCILLDTNLPHRWRGKYNEDTDLSLRLLKDGYCTLLFRALLMDKPFTHNGGENRTPALPGGNTDNVYNSNDFRKQFAKSLERQHPDVVKTVWKFGRYHHSVDYSKFRTNRPLLAKGIIPMLENKEYGMRLVINKNQEKTK